MPFVLMGLMTLGMIGGGYGLYAYGMLTPAPRLDKETFCLSDTPITHSTLILLDETNALNQAEFERLKDRVRKATAATPDFGLVTVAVLNPDDATSPRVVLPALCTAFAGTRFGDHGGRAGPPLRVEQEIRRTAARSRQRSDGKRNRGRALADHRHHHSAGATSRFRCVGKGTGAHRRQRSLGVQSQRWLQPDAGWRPCRHVPPVDAGGGSGRTLKGTAVTIEYVQRPEPFLARAQTPCPSGLLDVVAESGRRILRRVSRCARATAPFPPLPASPRRRKPASKGAWRRNCEC